MAEVRYLLAVRKDEDPAKVSAWTATLTPRLAAPGDVAVVTDTSTDFLRRAAGVGGYEPWLRSAVQGLRFDGSPLFHGVVLVTQDWAPMVGKGTYKLADGFLKARKYAWAWHEPSGTLLHVVGVTYRDGGTWQEYGWVRTRAWG